MANRLHLDWSLEWRDERNEFAHKYLAQIDFAPTSEELETLGKYILWGKNRETGLNGRQEGLELETKSGIWDSKNTESLEALLEAPTFNENSILREGMAPLKTPKEIFSRKEAREKASPDLLNSLESLWSTIDKLDLVTSFYDLDHGKRTAPIRESLLSKFTKLDLDTFHNKASTLNSFNYLKLKHQLVELRSQQYILKDSYAPTIIPVIESDMAMEYMAPALGTDIIVRPVPIFYPTGIEVKVFNKERFPNPKDFSTEDLEILSKEIWKKPTNQFNSQFEINFCEQNHLYKIFEVWEELCALEEEACIMKKDSSIHQFLEAARCYRQLAKLSPMHEDILEAKIHKKTNQEIVKEINEKYGKNYNANYISTLYCKTCLASIARAASDHREVIENLFFQENFKKCKDCGEVLLLSEKNFVKRHRSSDGYSPRCKRCEKKIRDARKKTAEGLEENEFE